MSLGSEQRRFTLLLGRLICYAYEQGYELTLGRGSVSEAANKADGGHKRSLHLSKLAQDLNLFKDGVYLTTTEDHRELGEYWESIGGTWGGRFESNPDGNHYSLTYGGMK